MENLFFYIQCIVLYIFYLLISITLLNYIICSFYFVLPMEKKYKILVDDLYKQHFPSRYDLCIISAIFITFMLFLLYALNRWIFVITSILLIIIFFISSKQYKKCNILDYINHFSEDLFDWNKIYDLHSIDEETKKQCFAIHHINYDEFKSKHLMYLKSKMDDIESKINKINLCPKCGEKIENNWNFCNYCGNKLK